MKRNKSISDDLNAIIPFEEGMPVMEWLAEQMPGGFFIYKAAEPMELLYANKPLCRFFGCSDTAEFEALTGNTFRGMVHPDDLERVQNSIDRQISADEDGKMDHVIYRITRKDGEIRWMDDYGHFASVPGIGGIYYVFINDITEVLMVQEEKERSRIMARALEEAEQASVAKTLFLSNMSHEIRTPINTILGMNEMLLREANDPSLRKYAVHIQRAGNALLSQINDVLDFSKIEAGKMDIFPDDYNLAQLLADIASIMSPRAADKGLVFSIKTDEDIPHILRGDNVRIRQILLNLTSNAIKYTKEGIVKVSVSYCRLDDKDIELIVEVRDTGIGIKESDISKLFEAFERIDEARNRTIEGTGLGMNIVWKLQSLMGGRLDVQSEYGKGSTFSFYLRQEVVDWRPVGNIDRQLSDVSTSYEGYQASFTASEAMILLVDDTVMNLMVAKGLLKYTDISIDTAADGKQALLLTQSTDYDALLIDHRMPVMDGMEMIRALRAAKDNPNANKPCIALTANAIAGAREEYLAAGFDDYLVKPVNSKSLEMMLIKYLPPEKVHRTKPVTQTNASMPPVLKRIEENGYLDTAEGVSYAGGLELYMATLKFFIQSIEAKSSEIRKYYEEEDWDNYKIKVHALKSTSKIIGAMELSNRARALELASTAGDIDYIREHTGDVLAFYRSYLKKVPVEEL